MIDFDNQTDFNCNLELLQKITDFLTPNDVELILVDNEAIHQLNLEHRNMDKPTDVLSFPVDFALPDFPLGSIVISIDFVKEKALEFDHSQEQEMALLYIHGLLHLMGYDHEIDQGEHREEERRVIEHFNLPNSLIIRNME